MTFIVSKTWSNFDFETQTVDILWKSSKICYFEVEHSKFYESNFGDFEVVNFWNLHEICGVLRRKMSNKSVSHAIECVLYYAILLNLATNRKIDCLKIAKIWLVKFQMFALFRTKKIFKIKQSVLFYWW